MRRALLGAVAFAVGVACGGPATQVRAEARAPRSVMSSAAVAAQQRAEREARAALETLMKSNGAPDIATLLEQLRDECDAGKGGSCGHLGRAYEFGNTVAVDVDEATRLYKRGCRLGWDDVCRALTQVANLRIEANSSDLEAAQLLRFACDHQYTRACTALGEKYARGRGVPASRSKAAELFGLACGDGDDIACIRLAELALKHGAKLKKPRAVRAVLRRMCEEGVAGACEMLGEIYRRGIGIDRSAKSAFMYHKRA